MKRNNNLGIYIFVAFLFIITIVIVFYGFSVDNLSQKTKNYNINKVFKIISSSENKNIENIILEYAKQKNIEVEIDYAGTLEIMEKLNEGDKNINENYDAIWISDSIWLYMLDDSINISESKSTSINPVIFAVKKSKAEQLGFVGKNIYTSEIVQAIKSGKLKFSMSNPTQTNTGATAYLGLLSSIAGSPEVLKESDIQNENLKTELVALFSGLERASGSEEFLEEMFLNGEYEAVVTYESSIININKQLEQNGQETLYALYPIDGVSISDSPFAYIDNGDESKKQIFLDIRNYILSDEGQNELAKTGRRTWYGGINLHADESVFNSKWGIDTTRYIVPIKFPNTTIIQEALLLYQTALRKPVHTVFCLDYSSSMRGDGYNQLTSAMKYILDNSEENSKKFTGRNLIQFTEKDQITVIPFSSYVLNNWHTSNGLNTGELLQNINELSPNGSTNIYEPSIEALKVLEKDDLSTYNASIVLMTDGMSNLGDYYELENYYKRLHKEIPIYSIMFGDARENQLQDIANLTNAKVFDGKSDLVKAFKEVRGYN